MPTDRDRAAPLPLRWALVCAALSALFFVPGLPPVAIWPPVLVSFAPLYLAIERQAPGRAFAIGWASGAVATFAGFFWLVETLRRFGELPLPAAVAVLVLLSAYNGARLGLACWLSSRAADRGWPAAPAFALAFLTSELLYPLVFPWYIATAADHALPLLQPAEIGGPLAVDLLMLVPSLALGEALRTLRAGRRPSARWLAVGMAVPALTSALGSLRMTQVRAAWASAPELTIGLVQGNAPAGSHATVEQLQGHTATLAASGVDLVIWPETAFATSYNDLTYTVTMPEQVTGKLGVPTVFGARMWSAGATPEAPRIRHNSVMLAGEAGAILGRYDKHVLLPFGEYTPFEQTFPALGRLLTHSGHFRAGEGAQPLVLGETRILAMVCYEDILPAYVNRQVVATDPDLLVNVTNDAWFGDTAEPWIHLGEARLRAIEHRRFLVRATNSGPSGVVDATGADGPMSAVFTEGTTTVTARMLRPRTKYERVGDVPFWIGACFSIAAAFVRRRGLPTP